MKIQWAPVKFIENDKEHVPDEVVHKRCSGTKKREADSPSDEARLGTLYAIRSRKRGSQAHLIGNSPKESGPRVDRVNLEMTNRDADVDALFYLEIH